MADQLRWGIMATGGIARKFADGLQSCKTGHLAAVGSRSIESATKFTEQFGGKPYGSYEELLADPDVDAVYIATPHHLHHQNTIDAARAGKAILCEKPFTLNSLEAERALAVVKECGVFFMEAFMYRCHPQTQKIKDLVQSGAIGNLLNINAEFGFQAGKQWDNFRAVGELGGGGLMDVGCYCVSMMRMVAGEPTDAAYFATISPNGYDEHGSGILKFANGVNGHFGTGVHVSLKNDVWIYGDAGHIEVRGPWIVGEGSRVILKQQGKDAEEFNFFDGYHLYAREADAVAESLEKGESPYMTIEDTVGQMRTLDMIRKSCGLEFGAEMKA